MIAQQIFLLLILDVGINISGLTFQSKASTYVGKTLSVKAPSYRNFETVVRASSLPYDIDGKTVYHDISEDTEHEERASRNPPWSQWQESALRDNVSKYRVSSRSSNGRTEYVLWRSMTRDIMELEGYDAAFVRDKYSKDAKLLPLLENFQFESGGGICGEVYGLPGIADGSQIRTPPLVCVERTVPLGYVETTVGSAKSITAYELGIPSGTQPTIRKKEERYEMLKKLAETTLGAASVEDSTKIIDNNSLLINLGSLTASLLIGATLMNVFQHHLTINVFWV